MAQLYRSIPDKIRIFSGEDYRLIKKSNTLAKNDFALIGATVLAIFLGCFWSAKLFFSELFHNDFLAFTIGVVWALMIVNIYLLLLYTISPTLLKNKHSEKITDKDRPPFFAFVFRIGFIVLLAIIIAQPVKFWVIGGLYPDKLDTYLEAYKQQLSTESIYHSLRLSITQEKEQATILNLRGTSMLNDVANKFQSDLDVFNRSNILAAEIDSLKKCKAKDLLVTRQNELNILMTDLYGDDSAFVAGNISVEKKELLSIVQKRLASNDETAFLIRNSNFYVSKIQLANKKFTRHSIVFTLLAVIIFLLPVFWKYQVRNLSNFYEVKKDIENRVVIDEYENFKTCYNSIFLKQYHKDIRFFESYTDAPFNTQKKSDGIAYKPQDDLLKLIYAGE